MSDWKPILEELERRRALGRGMGGPERVERLMTRRGKLDARRRLELLFDPGSFVELGTLVGGTEAACDALVGGFGRVNGRTVPGPRCSVDGARCARARRWLALGRVGAEAAPQ